METLLPFEKIKQDILVRKEATTNEEYGCRPENRTEEELIQNGIVNLNKPQGPTSHQIADYAKNILQVPKVGHSGTLDPNVSGVLPMATGNATKIVQVLLTAGKEYVVIIHIHDDVEESKIRTALDEFIGKITQLPPIRSAVKRQLRERSVYYLEVLEIDGRDVLVKVGCQAGTYIRRLADDLGKKIGCGAHMAELVRTKAGPFSYKNWVTLQDLKDAYETWKEGKKGEIRKVMMHVEAGVEHLAKIWIIDTAVDTLSHGAALSVPGIAKMHGGINRDDTVAVMTLKDELVALGTAQMNSQNMLLQQKGVAVNNLRVFMQIGKYPKFTKRPEATK